MSTIFTHLRHGQTKVDPETPISQWVLSEEGQRQAEQIAELPDFQRFDVIIVSGEKKAYQTAEPIAKKLGLTIEIVPEISELNRDKGGHMSRDEYEQTVKEMFEKPDTSVRNWEPAGEALKRFSGKMRELEQQYEGKRVLVVGHGYTMNMYFAVLKGESSRIYERLHENNFCSWGIIENGKVIRDLSPELPRIGEKMH